MITLRNVSLVAFAGAIFLAHSSDSLAQIGGANPPELAQWESNMTTYGDRVGNYLDPASGNTDDEILAAQYYDAQWVFYQIADYTDNKEPWETYGRYAEMRYRDGLLRPNDFRTQGYRRFPHGLYEDFRRGGDTTTTDMQKIRDNPAYSNIYELTRSGGRSGYFESKSREVAYNVNGQITAEKAGVARSSENGAPKLEPLVAMMENHLWEWRSQTYEDPNGGRLAAFMFGLTGHSLIEFYEWERQSGRDPNAYWPKAHWPDIITALEDISTWLVEGARVASGSFAGQPLYVSGYQGSAYSVFRYADQGSANPSPDLSQLIAPVYYWLYKETGSPKYLIVGDQLFGGAVQFGYHIGGKQFNQLYRLSFLSLKWRGEGGVRPNPPTNLTGN